MSARSRILLGEISGAHGIRGELMVRSHAAAPEDIASYGTLADESGQRQFELSVVRVTPKGVVVRIEGVADRTAAEKLKGLKLYVGRDRLPEAGDDEFYHADLIGLQAVDAAGSKVGTIIAVHNFGAGDLIEIRAEVAAETQLVPLTKACVPHVDLQGGIATVVLPNFTDGDRSDEDDTPAEA